MLSNWKPNMMKWIQARCRSRECKVRCHSCSLLLYPTYSTLSHCACAMHRLGWHIRAQNCMWVTQTSPWSRSAAVCGRCFAFHIATSNGCKYMTLRISCGLYVNAIWERRIISPIKVWSIMSRGVQQLNHTPSVVNLLSSIPLQPFHRLGRTTGLGFGTPQLWHLRNASGTAPGDHGTSWFSADLFSCLPHGQSLISKLQLLSYYSNIIFPKGNVCRWVFYISHLLQVCRS